MHNDTSDLTIRFAFLVLVMFFVRCSPVEGPDVETSPVALQGPVLFVRHDRDPESDYNAWIMLFSKNRHLESP